ncbi:MAG: hybrid sensor histidine kinase/response regulator [Acidiferrobacter sp.]
MRNVLLVVGPRQSPYYEPLVRCAQRLHWEVRCARGIADACRIIVQQGKNEVPRVVVVGPNPRTAPQAAMRLHAAAPAAHILLVADAAGRLAARLETALAGDYWWTVSRPDEQTLYGALSKVTEASVAKGQIEDSFASVFPHMIWSATAEGTVDYYNARWLHYTGLSLDALRTRGWLLALHADDQPRAQSVFQVAVRTGLDFEMDVRLRTRGGTWRWHLLHGLPKRGADGGVRRWYGICTDIDDRKQIELRNQFFRALGQRLAQSLDYGATLANLANVVVPYFADWCAVDIVGVDGRLQRLSVAHKDPTIAERIAHRRPDIEAVRFTIGEVIDSGKPLLLVDISPEVIHTAVLDPDDRAFLEALELHSVLRLPLRARGHILGVISFILAGPSLRRYSEADLPIAIEIARLGAVAADNARLYLKAQQELAVRAQTEAALAVSEARYRSVVEATAQIVWGLDAEGRAAGDMVGWCAFTGQSDAVANNYGWMDAVMEKYRSVLKKHFDSRLFASFSGEIELRHRDGGNRRVMIRLLPIFNDTGACREWIAAGTDVTGEREAREQLAREKEQLAVTLNSLNEAVITTDTEGEIVVFNRVAEQLTGMSSRHAIGQKLDKVFRIEHPQTRAPLADGVARVLRTGQPMGPAEHAILRSANEAVRLVVQTAAPIFNVAHRISGVVIVFRDISAQQKLEEDVLTAQKLESIGMLAGGIAHDFNNILTAIIGNLALARLHISDSQWVTQALTEAETASWRARRLTQQLLTFARGGAPIKRPGSLAALLDETVPSVLAGANVRYSLDIATDLWPLVFDAGQLSQAVNNLIINAKEAMPWGGLIRISAHNVAVMAEAALGLAIGRYVCLVVEDEGPGIPEDHINKIFDPYFTTKEHSSGLGLTTTYSIIHRHGGTIRPRTRVEHGACFEIYLPAIASAGLPLPVAAADRAHQRVLVMDDDRRTLDVVVRLLVCLGYDVTGARSGEEVVARYVQGREAKRPYAVVILGLATPAGMSSQECLARLRSIDGEVRVIACSGYHNDPIVADYERYGFQAVVVKPYQIEDLDAAVQRVVVENLSRLR